MGYLEESLHLAWQGDVESARAMLAQAESDQAMARPGDLPIAGRAWWRLFKKALILLAVLAAATAGGLAAAGVRPWSPGLLWLVPAPLIYYHCRRWTSAAGYALTPEAVLYRRMDRRLL